MLHGQMLHGQMLHGQMLHGQMLHGQMLHGQMLHGQIGTGEKLKLMLTQSICAGAGTELGKKLVWCVAFLWLSKGSEWFVTCGFYFFPYFF